MLHTAASRAGHYGLASGKRPGALRYAAACYGDRFNSACPAEHVERTPARGRANAGMEEPPCTGELRLSAGAAAGGAVEKFSRGIKVAGVTCCLLDHVQGHPAKIGDGLLRPVEPELAEQSRVQVL